MVGFALLALLSSASAAPAVSGGFSQSSLPPFTALPSVPVIAPALAPVSSVLGPAPMPWLPGSSPAPTTGSSPVVQPPTPPSFAATNSVVAPAPTGGLAATVVIQLPTATSTPVPSPSPAPPAAAPIANIPQTIPDFQSVLNHSIPANCTAQLQCTFLNQIPASFAQLNAYQCLAYLMSLQRCLMQDPACQAATSLNGPKACCQYLQEGSGVAPECDAIGAVFASTAAPSPRPKGTKPPSGGKPKGGSKAPTPAALALDHTGVNTTLMEQGLGVALPYQPHVPASIAPTNSAPPTASQVQERAPLASISSLTLAPTNAQISFAPPPSPATPPPSPPPTFPPSPLFILPPLTLPTSPPLLTLPPSSPFFSFPPITLPPSPPLFTLPSDSLFTLPPSPSSLFAPLPNFGGFGSLLPSNGGSLFTLPPTIGRIFGPAPTPFSPLPYLPFAVASSVVPAPQPIISSSVLTQPRTVIAQPATVTSRVPVATSHPVTSSRTTTTSSRSATPKRTSSSSGNSRQTQSRSQRARNSNRNSDRNRQDYDYDYHGR